jgi:hypothetical protein
MCQLWRHQVTTPNSTWHIKHCVSLLQNTNTRTKEINGYISNTIRRSF